MNKERILTDNELKEIILSLKEYIGRISKIRIYQELIVENNTVYFKINIYFIIIDTDFNQKISIISKVALDKNQVLLQLKSKLKLEKLLWQEKNQLQAEQEALQLNPESLALQSSED